MKKLTLNRLALAGLRVNWKEYRLLCVGVFLAVFFTVGTLLGLDILFQRSEAETAAEYGREDALYFSAEATPEELKSQGLARQAGAVTLVGSLRIFPVGCYDDTARVLLSQRCLKGRLPLQAGETAMDRQVLERLFRDSRIGDTLVLPITNGRGQTRQKEYRLVGVLQPQFQGDSRLEDYLPQGTLSLPRVLLGSPEDFAPICRHIVLTFPLGGSLEKCKESYPNASFLGIDSAGALYEDQPLYNSFSALKEQINMGSSLILAGSTLLLASLLGIFSAVSGQFYRKEEQYRMLRTIGATRRQIRAISSREAVLLTLLTAPVGSLCALGFVALLRRIFPESLPCAPRLRWVVAGAAVSCGLVWVAARLPGMVYRPQKVKWLPLLPIRSQREYRLPKLWNGRSLRFHPFRTVCEAVLMFLFFLSAFLFAEQCQSMPTPTNLKVHGLPELELRSYYHGLDTAYFTIEPLDHLTPEVLPELEKLPGVESVSGYWSANVITLTDHVGTYYPALYLYNGNQHLTQYCPEVLPEAVLEKLEKDPEYQRELKSYHLLQEQLQTDQIPFKLQLVVLSDLSELEPYLVSGSIDLDTINNGTAVLVDLPTYYETQQDGQRTGLSLRPDPEAVNIIRNDQIAAGDTLPLIQMCLAEGTYTPDFAEGDPNNFPFSQAEKRTAMPIVCGVTSQGHYGYNTGAVITTYHGLQSLGFSCDNTQSIEITLKGDVSKAEKVSILSTLDRLACREDHLEAWDNTVVVEESNGVYFRHLLFSGALAAMLFLLATMQLQGDLRRRIRSEKRTIGILRSVGCDEKTLKASYRRQITVSTCIGSVLTLLAYLSTFSPSYFLYSDCYEPALYWIAPFLVCATVLTVAVNSCLLKKDLHRLLQSSVMENIREE